MKKNRNIGQEILKGIKNIKDWKLGKKDLKVSTTIVLKRATKDINTKEF